MNIINYKIMQKHNISLSLCLYIYVYIEKSIIDLFNIKRSWIRQDLFISNIFYIISNLDSISHQYIYIKDQRYRSLFFLFRIKRV